MLSRNPLPHTLLAAVLSAASVVSVLTLSVAAARGEEPPLEKRNYTDPAGKTLPYRLLKPDNYDPAKKYPLVLFLHGAGERGVDNTAQLKHGVGEFASKEGREKYPCFLIAPQCPAKEKWADVNWSADASKVSEKPAEPQRLALEIVAAVQKEFSIDPKRLYITGLSMGGYGTWDIISRHPDMFAAAIPICGGGDESHAGKLTKIPLWCFHGDKDTAVKVERSRNMIEAVKKAGGSPKYTEYPGVGHDSWTRTYKDPEVLKWLFEQKKD
jgi:predicted peptidase